MDLIERYIAEIGKHLPARTRSDIQKELRSTLQDMLEDRSRQAKHPADEAMVVELLKKYGKPEKVAASYLPERQLIGPQLYPVFSLVCWIALSALGAVLLVTMSIGLFSTSLTPLEALKAVGSLVLQVTGALVSAFGSIVITFAILERIPWKKGFAAELGEEKDWDPRSLPQVRDVEKFSVTGLTAETILTAAAIVLFNFFPQVIGFGFLQNGQWKFLPVLSDAFFHYVPYFTGLWLLQIALNLILLRQGRWQPATRWVSIGLKTLGVVLAAVMLAGPDLIGSTAGALAVAAPNLSPDAASILTWLPRLAVKLALALGVVLGGLEVFKSIFQEITGKTRS
jgi:hypothetical protein